MKQEIEWQGLIEKFVAVYLCLVSIATVLLIIFGISQVYQ